MIGVQLCPSGASESLCTMGASTIEACAWSAGFRPVRGTHHAINAGRGRVDQERKEAELEATLRTQGSSGRVEGSEGMGGLRVGQVAGVEIRLDWSLIIIFALITISLGAGLFPSWHPTWSAALSWSLAMAAGVVFIASILVHELSHALVARTQGISVPRITLFVFGGLAHMERNEPPSPKAEFFMAIIGPIVSIAIGVLSTAAGVALAGAPLMGEEITLEELQAIGPLPTLLLWLGPINVLLGIFNMVPGFPLDGGRVLRSLLWAATKDIVKATRWASGVGQAFAWALMAFGVVNLFAGALAQGLWLLLIGWFLNNAARMSYQQLVLHKTLQDVPVSRVMMTQLDKVTPGIDIESLVRHHFMTTDQHAFPVEAEGALVGLVSLDDVRRVPETQWSQTRVEEIMTPMERLWALSEGETAERALEELAQRDVEQIPILDGRRILGFVRRSDIVKWMALQGV